MQRLQRTPGFTLRRIIVKAYALAGRGRRCGVGRACDGDRPLTGGPERAALRPTEHIALPCVRRPGLSDPAYERVHGIAILPVLPPVGLRDLAPDAARPDDEADRRSARRRRFFS